MESNLQKPVFLVFWTEFDFGIFVPSKVDCPSDLHLTPSPTHHRPTPGVSGTTEGRETRQKDGEMESRPKFTFYLGSTTGREVTSTGAVERVTEKEKPSLLRI